jgi:mRNA interferase MazF
MSIYKQRDIVLVPFPFSDLSGLKVRPVLILSSADVVVCGLTTNLRTSPFSIIVSPSDMELAGTLRHMSRVKADTIASLEQSILIKQIARLKFVVFNQVSSQIQILFQPK